MAQAQFIFPVMPFIGAVLSGSTQGSVVNICGRSFLSADKICINIQTGPKVEPRDDVALHITLDFNRNLIVRNKMQGQNWGLEETSGPPVNLIRGEPFHLDVICDVLCYKIIFNGIYYTEIKHAQLCINDFYLVVDGDALLGSIKIYDLTYDDRFGPMSSLGLFMPKKMRPPLSIPIPIEIKENPRSVMAMCVPPGMVNVKFVCIALLSDPLGHYNLQEIEEIINNMSDGTSSYCIDDTPIKSGLIYQITGDDKEEPEQPAAPCKKIIRHYFNRVQKSLQNLVLDLITDFKHF